VFLFPFSNFDYFLLFLISFFETRARQNGEPGNTGVVSGRGCKRQFKKVRTTSDDAGGKSVSEKSKSTVGQENVRVRRTPQVGNLVQRAQVTTPSSPQEVRSRNTSLM
jgi:hypothetical protein